jgi:hypothetical protein
MVKKIPDGPIAQRDGCSVKAEYKGKEFKVLLSDGMFQLVDTTTMTGDIRSYEDAWVWHMCDDYEREMVVAGATNIIGLMSNKEMYRQQCQYCQARIPDGMIGQFKMLNWEHRDEISNWEFKDDT